MGKGNFHVTMTPLGAFCLMSTSSHSLKFGGWGGESGLEGFPHPLSCVSLDTPAHMISLGYSRHPTIHWITMEKFILELALKHTSEVSF